MQTALKMDGAMASSDIRTSPYCDQNTTNSIIRMPVIHSNSPCVSCLSKSYCLQKSVDVEKLINPEKQYVQKFKVKKGDSIFNNGDDHKYLYNIRIGHIKIEYSPPNGQHQITQLGMPGDLIGLDGWADGKHHLAAYALNDGELCSINIKKFNKAMEADHSLAKVIEQLMSAASNHSQEHLFSLSMHSTDQKLAYFLIDYRNRLSHLNLRIDSMRLPLNRDELSNYLGMTFETLSRAFTLLEKKGYILVKNKDITFLDYEGLHQLIDSKK